MIEGLKLLQSFHLWHRRNGRVLFEASGKNLVVDAGKDFLATLFVTSPGATRMDWMALGSGSTAVSASDTALVTEIASSRTASTTAAAAGNEALLDFNFTAVTTWNVKEAGVFNAATAGTMFARFLTQEFTMALNDTLRVIWIIKFGG